MDALNFITLPALDGDEAPAFTTTAAAREWVAALPLTNPGQVQDALQGEINKLNHWTLPPAERMAILDALRKAVSFAQDEAGKRYGGKPLPLMYGEQRLLLATIELRRACVIGTLHCLPSALGEGDQAATALTIQRAMAHLASLHLECLRGGQPLAAEDWGHLHALLALAENQGVTTIPVPDPIRHGDTPTTALAAYGEALLLHAASPFEMPPRSLAWMARWARRWGAKLELSATPPDNLDAIPLAVDIASTRPPRHLPFAGPGARFLLTHALRDSLKSRIALLGQGRAPAELQLGDDCTQPACEHLLKQLYPRWCKGSQPRGSERHPDNAPGRLLVGSESLYYHLSGGKRLQQVTASQQSTSIADIRREREQMAMFGTVQAHVGKPLPQGPVPPIEDGWQMRDESATGLNMARPLAATEASRLKLGQLVAVEPPKTKQFFLASIRWLLTQPDDGGWLQAGAQLMPGPCAATAVQPGDAPQEGWRAAYFLPALAACKEEESIVVPSGMFRPNRVLKLKEGGEVRLTRLLARGDDYERVLYDAAG